MPAWARLFRGAVFRAGPLQGWDAGLGGASLNERRLNRVAALLRYRPTLTQEA